MMKLEEFLMQPMRETQQRRIALQEEVEELQQKLSGELKLNSILQNALRGPLVPPCPCLSSSLSPKVQSLLAELAMVETEINWLEKRTWKLKMKLYREKQLNAEWEMVEQPRNQQHQAQLPSRQQHQAEPQDQESPSATLMHNRRKDLEEGRLSVSSSTDMKSCSSSKSKVSSWLQQAEENAKGSQTILRNKKKTIDAEVDSDEPSRLSEELLKSLISIFLKMNQISSENEETTIHTAAKNNSLSCINPRSFSPKTTFSCKTRSSFNQDDNASNLDPYGIVLESDGVLTDVGPYKKFIQITRNSLKPANSSDSNLVTRKIRVLQEKLCYVDLTHLSYKQKLAFWINIYNACILHAYLQHGLPSTEEGMLTLLNKAAVNVGGIVLNALAIEHYILRHSTASEYGLEDAKETLLRHAYGLHYPEANITFALCRGNWSSPALRVYTPDNVVNELSRAKVEYLEASVGVTSKRKIQVPKLLQWNIQDFADDIKSLIEWIYSQLPPNAVLKRAIMQCLKEENKVPIGKMVETVPYEYEFRYLLPRYRKSEPKQVVNTCLKDDYSRNNKADQHLIPILLG